MTSVWYHTFGCKANQYDTERMRQELESRGASTSDDPSAATVAAEARVLDPLALEQLVRLRVVARGHAHLVPRGLEIAHEGGEEDHVRGVHDVYPDPHGYACSRIARWVTETSSRPIVSKP